MKLLTRAALLLALICLVTSAYAADAVKPLPFVKGSWTLVLLPDTQNYAKSHPKTLMNQTKWIVDNAAERNIAFVMGEGDVTQDNIAEQWKVAREAYGQLDGKVPYSIELGNHDYRPKPLDERATLAYRFFSASYLEKSQDYGGSFEKGKVDNSYYQFTAGGTKWIAITMEFCPRDEVLKWADKVLTDNADRTAIICTHAYLYKDNTRFDYHRPKMPKMVPGVGVRPVNDGEEMWQKLISKHANIAFVFCGHVLDGGQARLSSVGDAGNVVHQILADYQAWPNGGDGWLRLVEFLPDGKTVQVKTYSTTKDEYMTGDASQFTLEIARQAPKPVQ